MNGKPGVFLQSFIEDVRRQFRSPSYVNLNASRNFKIDEIVFNITRQYPQSVLCEIRGDPLLQRNRMTVD